MDCARKPNSLQLRLRHEEAESPKECESTDLKIKIGEKPDKKKKMHLTIASF